MSDKLERIRKQAEEILSSNKSEINLEEYKNNVLLLAEELSISQIELELQNKELRDKEYELQLEKQRYSDLFYNAPVGYLILNKEGIIINLNEKAKEVLDSNLSSLNKPFLVFLKKNQADLFFSHLDEVFNSKDESTKIFETELIIETKKVKKSFYLLKAIYTRINSVEL